MSCYGCKGFVCRVSSLIQYQTWNPKAKEWLGDEIRGFSSDRVVSHVLADMQRSTRPTTYCLIMISLVSWNHWLGVRATSHTSQKPWPCNGEDPRLSSKGRTMGVGKAVLSSHGPSSIVWSEDGPCCGTIAYFVSEKRGEDLVPYNMSQTLPIWENYLVVFVSPRIYYEICPEIRHAGNGKKNTL